MTSEQESAIKHPFSAAINLAKGTKNLVTMVEEAAVNAMVTSILGGDERLLSEKRQESCKAETGKASVEQKGVPREKEEEIQRLRTELEHHKFIHNESLNQQRKLEDELKEMKERLTLLVHKVATNQESFKKQEKKYLEEIKSLKEESNKRKEYKREEEHMKERKEEHMKERKEEKMWVPKEKHEEQAPVQLEQPVQKEQPVSEEEGYVFKEESPQETRDQEKESEEQQKQWTEEQDKIPMTLELKEPPVEQEEEFPLEKEEDNKEEHTLSEEEIAKRIKERHPTAGTIKVGGRRIKQNPSGPHITPHKPTLVETRDEKVQAENMGETAESTSRELAKEQYEYELALQEEKLLKHAVKRVEKGDEMERKILFPSTYFPPEPQNENQKRSTKGGLKFFQPPLHA